MKQVVFSACMVLFAVLNQPANAQDTRLQSVISAQMDAFLAGDLDQAFSYASPTIQSIFGSPENFGAMVRSGYPMVWRHSDVKFLSSETRDGHVWQDVLIRDLSGKLHVLEYQMIDGDDGLRINAVRVRPAMDGTA